MIDELSAERSGGSVLFAWNESRGWEPISGNLAGEMLLTLYLGKVELATMMCTPEKLNFLIAGFLRSEGLIEGLDDIALMRVCAEEQVAEVRLNGTERVPERRILTSGCGGGVTFDEGGALSPVGFSDLRMEPGRVLQAMKLLQRAYSDHSERGGLHLAGLSDGESLLVTARDVGRHNTIDKIWGECLFRGIDPAGKVLLATGRLSSEMMTKAAKMGVPITVSVNSPTDRSVEMANRLNITIVGYAKGTRLVAYSHLERLGVATGPNGR